MTLVVAFATPTLALVASDTRRQQLDSSGATVETFDDGSKMRRLDGGWLVGGGYVAQREQLFTAAELVGPDPDAIAQLMSGMRPQLLHELQSHPHVDAAELAYFWLVRPNGRGFTVFEGNWHTGAWGHAIEIVNAVNPAGFDARELGRWISARERAVLACTFDEAVAWTACLFRDVRRHLGPAGSVGPLIEIGMLTRDNEGAVRQVYLGPTPIERVSAGGVVFVDSATGKPKRAQDFFEGGYAPRATDAFGTKLHADVRFDPANGIEEGAAVRKLYRHREQAIVQDNSGDAVVTFPSTYQNAPAIALIPDQLITFNTSLGTGVDQVLRLKDINVGASGFTARAKNATVGATTARSADFPDSNELDAVGETTEADLGANVPANDLNYTVHYYVEVTANAGDYVFASVTVAIESRHDTDSWVERATYSYERSATAGTNTWTEEQKTISVSGLDTDDDIRLRIKSFTAGPGGGSFKVRGGDGAGGHAASFNGVTWTTASDTEESAMPAAGYGVKYIAQEVV